MPRGDSIDFSHIQDPRLARLADYWQGKRGDRPIPFRADIDPVDFPWLLTNVWLVQYEPAQDRFLYRLAGEEIRRVHPGIAFGRYIDEFLSPQALARIQPFYREVLSLDGGAPTILHMQGFVYRMTEYSLSATGERLVLPLLDGAGAPRFIFGATLYHFDSAPRSASQDDPPVTRTLVPLA